MPPKPRKPRKPKQTGGVFVGDAPTGSALKHLTRDELDAKAFEFLKEEPGGYEKDDEVETYYDLITYDMIDRKDPKSYITFARGENTIGIYNTITFQSLFDKKDYKDPHTKTNFSPKTKKEIERIIHNIMNKVEPVRTMVYSPDGSMRVFGHSNNGTITIQFMDEDKDAIRLKFPEKGNVYHLSFHPDGKHLAVCMNNLGDFIHIWDIHAGKIVKTIKQTNHGGSIGCYSPDGNLFAGSSHENKVMLYDVRHGYKRLKTFEVDKYLIKTDPSGNTIKEYDFPHCLAFDIDGTRLAVGTQGGSVYVWNLPSYADLTSLIKRFQTIPYDKYTDFKDMITMLAFHPDKTRLFAGGHQSHLLVWNLLNKQLIGGLKEEGIHSYRYFIKDFAIHPNGRYIAAAIRSKECVVWDIQSTPAKIMKIHDTQMDETAAIAFHPDGTKLTVVSEKGFIKEYPMQELVSPTGSRVGGRKGLKGKAR